MKKICILIIFAVVMAAFTAAQAEVRAGSASFGLSAGGYVFEGNQDYKNNVTLGVRAGYNFTENWGSEIFCNWVPSEFEDSDSTNRVYVAGLEGLYHFMPRSSFVPFLAIGIGAIHYTSDDSRLSPSKVAADYGAGFKLFLTDNVALRVDVRHVLPLGDSLKYGDNPHDVHNDLMATVGINFAFGGTKAAQEAQAKGTASNDSDNDGVPDDFDKCSCTPEGVMVNDVGCPLPDSDSDSDRDGVSDNHDKCPGTPAGVAVRKDGCPLPLPPAPVPAVAPAPQASDLDSDRDGVPDDRDKCPGTPASVVVNKNGCPPDADDDGVPDYQDNCQGTPAGAKVDKDGCPPDSDLDGIPDSLDKCPGTPSGTVVDKNGCLAAAERKIISIRLEMEFDTGKTVVKKKYHNKIKVVGDFMKEHPDATATIVGHTDNVDTHNKPERNMRLSQARAQNVRQYLIKKFGIKGSRITAIGYGAEKPIASNATKEGRQKNRRIVAVIETSE